MAAKKRRTTGGSVAPAGKAISAEIAIPTTILALDFQAFRLAQKFALTPATARIIAFGEARL
jgi:hypothetical protein